LKQNENGAELDYLGFTFDADGVFRISVGSGSISFDGIGVTFSNDSLGEVWLSISFGEVWLSISFGVLSVVSLD